MQIFGTRTYHAGLSIRTVGSGRRLVLIHGGSGSRTHWTRNVDALAANFTVSTIDLPGLGESATPPSDISNEEYVEWAAQAVLLAAEGGPYDLVGFSFGGAVSAAIAAKLAPTAQGPGRITLISPAGMGKPANRTIRLEKVKKSEDDTIDDIRAATARNLGRWMLAKAPLPDDEAVDIHLQNASLTRFDSRVISLQESLVRHLKSVDCPTQILLGEQDPLIFPSLTDRKALLCQSLPHATVETIPDAGHWLQYEANDAVNTRIQRFHN